MPEYFDISFIEDTQISNTEYIFLNKYNIQVGKNVIQKSKYKILETGEFIFSSIDINDADFKEYVLSFSNITFHRKYFAEEVSKLTQFVEDCFEECKSIKFALCSYEINGSLISDRQKLADFNTKFLNKFPIAFERRENISKLILHVNHSAQEILI